MDRKINIHNYEEFFLDYLDGNLSESEIVELEDFLLENPDLRKELEGMEEINLQEEKLKFPNPENLKQIDLSLPVTEENFDFFCIANMEGDLNEEQNAAFSEYLKENPSKAQEKEIFGHTRLKADQNKYFSNKQQLRKTIFVVYRREFRTAAAIAAGIALLMVFWFSFMEKNPDIKSLQFTEEREQEKTEEADSTSSTIPKDNEKIEENKKSGSKILNLQEKSKEAVKKAATKISFKVGIPIASLTETEDSIIRLDSSMNKSRELLRPVRIDPSVLSAVSPLQKVDNDPLDPIKYVNGKSFGISTDPDNYLTLQEFAKQKLSDLIFKNDEKDLNAVNVASAGIDKINSVAGTNMKLEASAKEETGEKVLKFNSKLISFSTPINRED